MEYTFFELSEETINRILIDILPLDDKKEIVNQFLTEKYSARAYCPTESLESVDNKPTFEKEFEKSIYYQRIVELGYTYQWKVYKDDIFSYIKIPMIVDAVKSFRKVHDSFSLKESYDAVKELQKLMELFPEKSE